MPNQVTIKPSDHVFTVQGDEFDVETGAGEPVGVVKDVEVGLGGGGGGAFSAASFFAISICFCQWR